MDILISVYITGLLVTAIVMFGVEDRQFSRRARLVLTIIWFLFWLAVLGGMALRNKRKNHGQSGA